MVELISILAPQIKWIVVLIAIDVILGIIAALVKKDFRLGKVANFMWKPVLGYIFGFVVLARAVQVIPALAVLGTIAYILIILALIGSILNNLGKLGVTLPAYLKKE